MSLLYWHHNSGSVLTLGQVSAAAMVASAVTIPALGYLVYKSETANADLRRLRRISQVDTLTGVLNRRNFDEQVNGHIAATGEAGSAGTFLFIDVDTFKAINDRFGHALGDRVLEAIGTALVAATRPSDILGRLGGDEFGIFLPRTGLEGGVVTAESLRRTVVQNCQMQELGDHLVSVSIGIGQHRPGTSLSECIRAADRQLYAAKGRGRNRVAALGPQRRPAA